MPNECRRARLFIALGISLALHLTLVPLATLDPTRASEPEAPTFRFEKARPLVFATATPPTPVPATPAPTPRLTATPMQHAPPHVAPIVAHPRRPSASKQRQRASLANRDPVPERDGAPAGDLGSQSGDGGDGLGSGSPSAGVAAPAPAATTAPPPTPTPKPACARPAAPARTVDKVVPEVPPIAAQQGAVGSVDVRVSLSARGDVVAATVVRSAGNAALDAAARDAALRTTYAAEIVDCTAQSGSYLFRVDFTGY